MEYVSCLLQGPPTREYESACIHVTPCVKRWLSLLFVRPVCVEYLFGGCMCVLSMIAYLKLL